MDVNYTKINLNSYAKLAIKKIQGKNFNSFILMF